VDTDTSTETVALSRIPFATTTISPEAREAVSRVLDSGWVTSGPQVLEFEREFAALVGAQHAVATASCTSAIELALRALDLPEGSKVLVSTMTFCGAVNSILHAGLMPVLADVDEDTLMPDERALAEAAAAAGGVDAMLVTHFAGQPASVEQMAQAVGLPLHRVVEDAAHAFGTWVGDRPVGALSAATCFSFYATKNLPIGEGGMLTTSNEEIAAHVARSRLHGMSKDAWARYLPGSSWRYSVELHGLKANMTDIQAAIGLGQLGHFSAWQARRAELVRRYDAQLSEIPGVRLPARPERGRHAWHLYVIQLEPDFGLERDPFMRGLAERGVECSVHFIPIHHHPLYRRVLGEHVATGFPAADAAFDRIVSLPLHPGLADDDVDRVCAQIAELRAPSRSPGTHPLVTVEGARNGNGHGESEGSARGEQDSGTRTSDGR
jgi:perosamine synthetase